MQESNIGGSWFSTHGHAPFGSWNVHEERDRGRNPRDLGARAAGPRAPRAVAPHRMPKTIRTPTTWKFAGRAETLVEKLLYSLIVLTVSTVGSPGDRRRRQECPGKSPVEYPPLAPFHSQIAAQTIDFEHEKKLSFALLFHQVFRLGFPFSRRAEKRRERFTHARNRCTNRSDNDDDNGQRRQRQ